MRHRNRRHCGMRTRSFMKGAAMADRDPNNGIVARIAEGVAALPKAAWDACNASGNPFMSHDFLSALEDSGSVGPGTGWKALPIVINDADDRIAAALPAYVKGHSRSEEHTSELQSLMRNSYAVFCLKNKNLLTN